MNARRLFPKAAPILLVGALLYVLGSPRARAIQGSSAERGPTAGDVSPIEVEGTRILVRKADGSFASDEELVGAVLVARGAGGIRNVFRIDSIDVDPKDPSGEVLLYSLSTKDPETGAWKSLCTPDAQGISKGFRSPARGPQAASIGALPGSSS